MNGTSMDDFSTYIVVDANYHIRYISSGPDGGIGSFSEIIVDRGTLQPHIESLIRTIAAKGHDGSSSVRAAMLPGNRVLRVAQVVGNEGTMFILSAAEDRNANILLRAARRSQLTRRETEVLSLILDGSSAGEIAELLCLSEHTVQGTSSGSFPRPAHVIACRWSPGCSTGTRRERRMRKRRRHRRRPAGRFGVRRDRLAACGAGPSPSAENLAPRPGRPGPQARRPCLTRSRDRLRDTSAPIPQALRIRRRSVVARIASVAPRSGRAR